MPFLTGDDTAATVDISLNLPDDEHLIAAVLGQLSSLTYASNWEQHGTATPAQRADEMRAAIGNLDHAPGGDMLTISDRKPDYMFVEEYIGGVDAGTFNAGAWRDRNLNVIALNKDGVATLVSNAFSVPTGRYWCYAWGMAFRVGRNSLMLWNVESAFFLYPSWRTSVFAPTGSGHAEVKTETWAYEDFDDSKTYKLIHRCDTNRAGNGFGVKSTYNEYHPSGVMLWLTD